ncbi:MAG TPA: carbohydrate ABC transporter permease [Clostridiales bacterium]|jgi:multiple sugar transport system permease protein|nr:carbohydrate ABC transporter permease [Clostridiales bacterium]
MKRRLSRFLPYIPLSLAATVVLLPVLFVAVGSFMSAEEIREAFGVPSYQDGQVMIKLIPQQVTITNYREILLLTPNYLYKFWNSMLFVTAIVVGQVVIASMGGYTLAKFRFPEQGMLFFITVILMLMPNQVTLVPHNCKQSSKMHRFSPQSAQ